MAARPIPVATRTAVMLRGRRDVIGPTEDGLVSFRTATQTGQRTPRGRRAAVISRGFREATAPGPPDAVFAERVLILENCTPLDEVGT